MTPAFLLALMLWISNTQGTKVEHFRTRWNILPYIYVRDE